jgi:hypothetical protein
MSLDSVSDVRLLLARAQVTALAWRPDVCDNEEDRTICEEVLVISRDITDHVSRVLGNEDGQGQGHEDDSEGESELSSDEDIIH